MSDVTDQLTSLLDDLLAEADNGQNMTRAAMLAERISGLFDTLRAQLAEAQAERDSFKQALEYARIGRDDALERERELQARLAEIERQEPVAVFKGAHGGQFVIDFLHGYIPPANLALYAAPVSPAAQVAQVAQGVAEDVVRDAIKRACQYYKQAGRVCISAPMLARQHEETADRLIATTLAAAQQQNEGKP